MTAELYEASYVMANRLGLEAAKQKIVEGYAKELFHEVYGMAPYDRERWEREAKEKLEACL